MKVSLYARDDGFTLLELLVTVIIAGILAAIAAPNFYGLLKRNEVNEGIASLENALKEAQKIAIRESKQCTVTINAGTNSITAAPTDCLPTSRTLRDDLKMSMNTRDVSSNDTNVSTIDIDFSYKGNLLVEGDDKVSSTIVLYSDFTDNAKCLFAVEGVGLIKVGEYTGSVAGNNPTINSNNCAPAD